VAKNIYRFIGLPWTPDVEKAIAEQTHDSTLNFSPSRSEQEDAKRLPMNSRSQEEEEKRSNGGMEKKVDFNKETVKRDRPARSDATTAKSNPASATTDEKKKSRGRRSVDEKELERAQRSGMTNGDRKPPPEPLGNPHDSEKEVERSKRQKNERDKILESSQKKEKKGDEGLESRGNQIIQEKDAGLTRTRDESKPLRDQWKLDNHQLQKTRDMLAGKAPGSKEGNAAELARSDSSKNGMSLNSNHDHAAAVKDAELRDAVNNNNNDNNEELPDQDRPK
jgi:hypothetical protein